MRGGDGRGSLTKQTCKHLFLYPEPTLPSTVARLGFGYKNSEHHRKLILYARVVFLIQHSLLTGSPVDFRKALRTISGSGAPCAKNFSFLQRAKFYEWSFALGA